MTLQELKALAQKANDGSQPIDSQDKVERDFADALRRIGDELLGLWEAVDTTWREEPGLSLPRGIYNALAELTKKSATMAAQRLA